MAELLINCKACGKQVSTKAKICPHCGRRLKMALWLKVVLGIVVLMVLSNAITLINSVSSENAGSSSNSSSTILSTNSKPNQPEIDARPEEQNIFENLIATYSKKFDAAQNELQESTFRRERMDAIKDSNIDQQIDDWVGTLNQLKTNSEGKAYITIKLNNNLTISTWNNALSDIGNNTLIPMDSDLYKALTNMQTGQKVKFSGFFIQSNDDYFREKSLTIRGSMKTPDFLMTFSSVEAIN